MAKKESTSRKANPLAPAPKPHRNVPKPTSYIELDHDDENEDDEIETFGQDDCAGVIAQVEVEEEEEEAMEVEEVDEADESQMIKQMQQKLQEKRSKGNVKMSTDNLKKFDKLYAEGKGRIEKEVIADDGVAGLKKKTEKLMSILDAAGKKDGTGDGFDQPLKEMDAAVSKMQNTMQDYVNKHISILAVTVEESERHLEARAKLLRKGAKKMPKEAQKRLEEDAIRVRNVTAPHDLIKRARKMAMV